MHLASLCEIFQFFGLKSESPVVRIMAEAMPAQYDGNVKKKEEIPNSMTKEQLIEILQRILKTEAELGFLMQLKKPELETLIACIRDRVDQPGEL